MTPGPRRELLDTGRLGPAGAGLLYRAVRSVALARNFPPPDGHSRWDDPAVQSVAHDFLTGLRAEKRLAALLTESTDEDSFESLLHTAVLNAHRDRGRATDLGALVLRVNEVLTDSDLFRRAADPSRWTLAAGPDEPSVVPTRVLLEAAAGVGDVNVPRWTSATRRAPAADRDTFIRLLTAILTAAAGSVAPADLARACANRLDSRHVPLTVPLDVLEFLGHGPDDAPAEAEALNRMVARDLFAGLSDRERMLLVTYDLPVREAADLIGLGRSQVSVLRQRLVEHLSAELRDDPDGEDVLSELFTSADSWLHHRTGGQGATFPTPR